MPGLCPGRGVQRATGPRWRECSCSSVKLLTPTWRAKNRSSTLDRGQGLTPALAGSSPLRDRKSGGEGKRGDLGGRRIIKKKKERPRLGRQRCPRRDMTHHHWACLCGALRATC